VLIGRGEGRRKEKRKRGKGEKKREKFLPIISIPHMNERGTGWLEGGGGKEKKGKKEGRNEGRGNIPFLFPFAQH